MRTKHEQNIWNEIMINLNLEETKRILAQNGHYKLSDKLEIGNLLNKIRDTNGMLSIFKQK